jgi:hypothetical protein
VSHHAVARWETEPRPRGPFYAGHQPFPGLRPTATRADLPLAHPSSATHRGAHTARYSESADRRSLRGPNTKRFGQGSVPSMNFFRSAASTRLEPSCYSELNRETSGIRRFSPWLRPPTEYAIPCKSGSFGGNRGTLCYSCASTPWNAFGRRPNVCIWQGTFTYPIYARTSFVWHVAGVRWRFPDLVRTPARAFPKPSV